MNVVFRNPSAMAGWALGSLPAVVLLLIACHSTANAQATGQATRRPNVLLIAVDDLNDWVGFLKGHPQVQTPHMDRLAQRGLVFASAQCAAPLCCPSRAAIFSGQQPYRTGIYHNGPNIRQFHPELVLLPQYLAQHGYRTFGTGKLLHHKTPEIFDESFTPEQRWSPLKNTAAAAFTQKELAANPDHPRHIARYGRENHQAVLPLNGMPSDRRENGTAGESFDWGPFDVSDDEMGDGQITAWAIERLQRTAKEPFFLGVGYYRPHIPLWAPRRYFDLYRDEKIELPKVLATDLDDLSPAGRRWALEAVTAGAHKTVVEHGQWEAAVTAYLACVSFVDAQIGRLLDALDHSSHKDNTIIVLWGDHGWHLGEKQHWGKWTGWERATRVPLVIAPATAQSSGFQIAVTSEQPVSLIDLYPTLIELCGLPTKSDLDGQSLVPLLKKPETTTRPIVTTFDRGNYSVRTERWRFIHYADGSEELYDHTTDAHEWHNLASQPGHNETLAGLRKLLPPSAAQRLGPAVPES